MNIEVKERKSFIKRTKKGSGKGKTLKKICMNCMKIRPIDINNYRFAMISVGVQDPRA